MKKNFKTMAAAIAVTGTMAMTMGTSMSAFADSKTDSQFTYSDSSISDTATITLIKDYVRATGSQGDSKSPVETFTFTITPYAVWNAGSSTGQPNGTAYSTSNMPAWGTNGIFTITVGKNQAGEEPDISKEIDVPEFKSVGDFWYQVEETNNHVTGVTYATNAASATNHIYYIHVQVTNDTANPGFIRTVTLHKTAPDTNTLDTNDKYNSNASDIYNATNKVYDIQNTYSAGTLTVEKSVTGNAGDKDKRFEVKVTFTKPNNTILNSDIEFKAAMGETDDVAADHIIAGQATGSEWKDASGAAIGANSAQSAISTVTIWVKNGEPVVFKNIPYGVSYTVQEMNTANQYTKEKYIDPVFELKNNESDEDNISGSGWDTKANGKISNENDTVKITNEKNVTIDVGVLLSNAPYAAMLALAGTAGVVFVKRRKKDIED